MLNNLTLIGRVGREPELRTTQNGISMCSFSLCTDESFNDKEGNRIEQIEWFNIKAFAHLAETCSKYLSKGRLVYIEGPIRSREYEDNDGVKKKYWEVKANRVKFLSGKNDSSDNAKKNSNGGCWQQNRGENNRAGGRPQNSYNRNNTHQSREFDPDIVPF